jgi:hypothetical protein
MFMLLKPYGSIFYGGSSETTLLYGKENENGGLRISTHKGESEPI